MILVVGATGILGGMITKQLLGQNRDVSILVRKNSASEQMALQGLATSPQTLIDSGATPIYGDLKNKKSLYPALENSEIVITTANSAMRGGDDTVDSVDRRGNKNLIEVAKELNVRQFIFISFLGADINHPVPLFQAKAETETHLMNSGITYTILSPNYFMESWIGMVIGIPLRLNQPIMLVGEGKRLHSLISINDVVAFATAVINHKKALNRRLLIGGPESVSWVGIIDAFKNILGQVLPVTYVDPGNSIPGLPEIVPAVLAGMETYDSILTMDEMAPTFGVEQTMLSSVVHNMLKITAG